MNIIKYMFCINNTDIWVITFMFFNLLQTSIEMDRSCTDDKDIVVLNSDSSLLPSSDISLPSSIVTCSSSIHSLVTSSWSISLSDTSTSSDEDDKYKQRNTARGLEREPYSDHVTLQEFETQLNAPAVATYTVNQYRTIAQDVFPQQTVPINVPGYSASLNTSTLSHTMDQYNKIVTPNSPNTAWYMK